MPGSEEPPSDRTPWPVYVAVAAPVSIATVAAATQPWLPPSHLLRDAQAVAAAQGDTSTAYGLISNLGIVATVLAAGAALLAWMAVRRTDDVLAVLLVWAFSLSVGFALDDLLLLHETAAVSPWAGHLVTAAYGAAFLAFVGRFLQTIRERLDSGLILLAIAAFAVSALVDLVATPSQASVLIEDFAKLLGIIAWSTFVVRAALAAVRSTAADGAPAPRAREALKPAQETARAGTTHRA